MKTYCVSCKKNTENENSTVTNKKTKCFNAFIKFSKKNQLLLKIKNLMIFQMINLK